MLTAVLISFDTEDFVSPAADDALLRLATLLTSKGLRGSFCMVGEKSRVLRERGRQDVLAALLPHEICFHSRDHSVHPTLAPRCDEAGWTRGLAEVRATELEAMSWVKEIHRRDRLFTAVPPGSNVAPQTIWLYQRAGIPTYAGGFFGNRDGKLYWYLGSLQVPYTIGADGVFAKQEVDEVWKRFDAQAGWQTAVLCIHPTYTFHHTFWDKVNFDAGTNRPRERWEPAPARSDAEREALFERLSAFLDRIKADPRFAFTDYETLSAAAERKRAARRPSAWPAAAFAPLAEQPDWIEHRGEGGGSLSAQEALGELAARVTGDPAWREQLDPRRLPGPVDTPHALERDVTLSRAEVLKGLWKAQSELGAETQGLPAAWKLNGCSGGPGAMLAALAQLAQGRETATLKAGHPETCAGVKRSGLDGWKYGAWLYKPGFEGAQNLKLAKQMAWTLCPAEA